MIHGIDVSSAQATGADWGAAFAAGRRYAWVKASEGNTGRDPAYLRHLEAGSLAQMWMGAYHFCRPNFGKLAPSEQHLLDDAETEARNFFEATGGWGQQSETLPPLLDVESCDPALSSEQFVRWVSQFKAAVERLWRIRPVVYTGQPMAQRGGKAWAAAVQLRECPLMIAAYPSPKVTPANVATRRAPTVTPWPRATVWQYSGDNGNTCPGFGAVSIDHSVAYVESLDDLREVLAA